MIATRIVAHGIVNGHVKDGKFSLGGLPFTIYLRPKSSTSNIDEVMTAKLFNEDEASAAPFSVYDWSPMYISELTVPASITSAYDVYWGSGYYVAPEAEED